MATEARSMAEFIEKWLGNPVSRKALAYLTKRSEEKRRIERVLKKYAGKETKLSLREKLAYLFVAKLVDWIVKKTNISRQEIKENLRTGFWRKGLASVLEGIAWRGPQKPFTSYFPFLIVWNFTNACNLNCEHCYQEANNKRENELSTKEAKKVVDELADEGLAYIAMSGGEPLARDDFFEVAEKIRQKEMGFSLATNGTLLTKEVVNDLEELNCQYVQVSVDGTKETHNRMRGKNIFERTVNGIRRLANSDITTGVAMTVTEKNYQEVDSVIELTEDLGADIFMHYNFIPTGRGKEIKELDLDGRKREKLLKKLHEKSKTRDINLLSTAPQYGRVCAGGGEVSLTHFDTLSQEGMGEDIEFLAEFVGGCGTGRLYCALQPNGDITPCVFLPKKIGNILSDDFLEVWKNNSFLEKIRKRESFDDPCGSCGYNNICGGCRARAYSYFDDVQEPDPGCVRYHGDDVVSLSD